MHVGEASPRSTSNMWPTALSTNRVGRATATTLAIIARLRRAWVRRKYEKRPMYDPRCDCCCNRCCSAASTSWPSATLVANAVVTVDHSTTVDHFPIPFAFALLCFLSGWAIWSKAFVSCAGFFPLLRRRLPFQDHLTSRLYFLHVDDAWQPD